MKKLLFLLLFFSALKLTACPQTDSRLDSLLQALPTASGNDRVNILNQLCWLNRELSPDKAITYSKQAQELAKKNGFRKGLAQAYKNSGILFYDKGNFDQALEFYNLALPIREELKDQSGIASLYNNIALVQDARGDHKGSLASHLKSLRIYESLGDKPGISQTLNNIAVVHQRSGDLETALAYQHRSLKIKKEIHDRLGHATALLNIATIYEGLNQLDKALAYSEKALADLRQLDHKEYLAAVLNNLAILYMKSNRHVQGLTCAQEAYHLIKETGNRKAEAAMLLTMGEIYTAEQDFTTAENYYRKGLALARSMDQQPVMADAYELLAKNQAARQNYRQAFESVRQYASVKDSLFNKNMSDQLNSLQQRYENLKQADQIALLNRQKEIQRLNIRQQELLLREQKSQLLYLSCLLIAIVIIAAFLYSRRRLKQHLKEKQLLLVTQKQRSLAVVEAEEKERKRIGSDLHDGLGQLLSIARLNLSGLKEDLDTASEMQQQLLQNALDVLDEALREVRVISHNLASDPLRQQGIARAVQLLLDQISQTDRYTIHFEAIGLKEEPVPQFIEKVVYRVIQECLSNILKHAQATHISLQLIRHEHELTVMIEDNGRGFDLHEINQKPGIGLKNIRSRVEYLNGTVHFDSDPTRGTIISIAIPLLSTASPTMQNHEPISTQHPLTTR
ncbi:tetratricopeptide repeat-containing sensor histidine kinase [Adhaeribacter soli]|uniref:Tetratricopeptide repeat protein n=1 Tax=Adhaeribacter soli TaxID=2607655 RepID=A0A5N1IKT2_9BACT|nr:tetratricopeptide repeat protein [Adhaeribacter soli]KAA9327292.1 tetratricopeptide repeat protein [Adhaeribacter soli]